jgi:NAD(P)-dependent dehydrogenase (short-subunit alcohol dehydrogenase family)
VKPLQPRKIIILGALSAMAEAAARRWATNKGTRLIFAGRNAFRLESLANDLKLRGADTQTFVADLATVDTERALSEMIERLGGVDIVLVAYGVLGDQPKAEANFAEAQHLLSANFVSAAGWCLAAANVLEKQGHGCLIVIGSVAGDRGRHSNYVYGAAKGGLGILVQGIAHRLARTGARAVLIKPGFVDTPMTAHIERKGVLWAKPETLGKLIVRIADAPSRRRPVVYAPAFWRWIMLAMRNLPASLFHRMRL